MNKLITISLLLIFGWINVLLPQNIEPILILSAGGSFFDAGNAVAIDDAGNIYTAGLFEGTASFGTTTLTSAGGWDMFITKHDQNGNLLWARRAGGPHNDAATGIAVAGNAVYVTGFFGNTINFNTPSSTGSNELVAPNSRDMFVAKFDVNGNFQWARRAGGTSTTEAKAIAVADNSVYLCGFFRETINFNSPSAPGSNEITSSGFSDIFIAKYDDAGNFQWAKRAGGTNDDEAWGIAISGNSIFLSGTFRGTADFNTPSSPGSNELVSAGQNDIFLAKYDDTGNFLWAKRAGGSSWDRAKGIAVSAGAVYIAGSFNGTANFNTPSAPGSNQISSVGMEDIFVAKYDEDGDFEWARRAGGSDVDEANGIAVSGNMIYVTGLFYSSIINFNTPSSFDSNTVASAGSSDIFLATYDDAGNFHGVQRAGGTGNDFGIAIAVSGSAVHVTGVFRNIANFNTPSAPGSNEITSAGSDDIFIVKYADPVTVNVRDVYSNSITLYPNPTTNHLRIDLGKIYSNVTFEIHNINGQLIERKSLQSIQQHDLNVSQWIKGVYFISVISVEGVVNKKFIKQ